jgi:hypothetical protein
LEDAGGVAAVLHYRVSRVTSRPAGSGRTQQPPRLVVGLIPEARGPMSADMRQGLTERRDLIEQRAADVLDTALRDGQEWTRTLGPIPTGQRAAQTWWHHAVTVAAYRGRYQVTDPHPLGAAPTDDAQKIDAARAQSALTCVRQTTATQAQQFGQARRTTSGRSQVIGRGLLDCRKSRQDRGVALDAPGPQRVVNEKGGHEAGFSTGYSMVGAPSPAGRSVRPAMPSIISCLR